MKARNLRNIKLGNQFNKYFGKPSYADPLLHKGNVYSTLDAIQEIVSRTLNQTNSISQLLQGKSLHETTSNIWHFIYNHIQYKIDTPGIEELREPNRTWADRNEGVDCDCYSIFISSILTNLKIPHKLRITEYDNKGYFQHVYVIVPNGKTRNGQEGYFIIDPVVDQFNYEKPFTKKFDKAMAIQHQLLNGIGNTMPVVAFGNEFNAVAGLGNVTDEGIAEATRQHLSNTLALLMANPKKYADTIDPEVFANQLQYALDNWHDPVARMAVLEELEEMEELGEMSPVQGVSGLGCCGCGNKAIIPNRTFSKPIAQPKKQNCSCVREIKKPSSTNTSVSKIKALKARRQKQPRIVPATFRRGTIQKSRRLGSLCQHQVAINGLTGLGGFFSKVKSAIKNTASKVGTAVKNTAAKVKTKVATTAAKAKEIGKKVLQNNPLTFAIKKALLGALKVNLFKLSEKLYWGYIDSSKASRDGFNTAEFSKLKGIVRQLEDAYKKMGGNPAEIKAAVLHGAKRAGLGAVAAAAGAVAGGGAAAGIIAKFAGLLKKINFKNLLARVKNVPAKIKEKVAEIKDNRILKKAGEFTATDRVDIPQDEYPVDEDYTITPDGSYAVDDSAVFTDPTLENQSKPNNSSKSGSNKGLIIAAVAGVGLLAAFKFMPRPKKTVNGVEVEL